MKQPIEAYPDVAVLVTEGVVGVMIDGLFFDEKGGPKKSIRGTGSCFYCRWGSDWRSSETSDNDEDIEEAITPIWKEEEIELIGEMELKLELAPVPL